MNDVTLSHGLGLKLNLNGSWDIEKVPQEAIDSAKVSGYLTINGYKSTVFDTNVGTWAQKSVDVPVTASTFSERSNVMSSIASRVAARYLQSKENDVVSQVSEILNDRNDSDDKYDEEILKYCEEVHKVLPEMQEIFDDAFHAAMDFKSKIPDAENPKIRQLVQEKISEMVNEAAARIELISYSLKQEVESLCASLEVGAGAETEEKEEPKETPKEASSKRYADLNVTINPKVSGDKSDVRPEHSSKCKKN